MNTLTFFQKEIILITGCEPDHAKEVEDYMRNMIFGHGLGHLKCSEFSKGAKEAHAMLKLAISHIHLN